MSLIHVYNSLTDYKKNYEFTGKIKDNIKDINFENCIILKAGKRIDADYEVQENDIILIRQLPAAHASQYKTADWVAGILTGGLWFFVSEANGNKLDKEEREREAKRAEAEAKAKQETVDSLPFLKGCKNKVATGQIFPYIIGKTYFSPYTLAPAYYTISGTRGENQYLNFILEAGYNNLAFNKIKIGDAIIKNFGDDATPQQGVYQWDDGEFYDEENILEIRQTGDFETDAFNKKIICTEINKEIPHRHAVEDDQTENEKIEEEWRTGIVQTLPKNALSTELLINFEGLQEYNREGKFWDYRSVTLRPQWTNADNPQEDDWHNFDQGFNQNGNYNNTFTYNTAKTMRYSARQDFTADQTKNKNLRVRIIRETPLSAGTAKERVYIIAVQTQCYDPKKSEGATLVPALVLEPHERDKCARVGIRVKATKEVKDTLDNFNVVETGCAATWDGAAWTETKQPTRNLAAWVREILLSNTHKPSQYAADELDNATWGAYYNYCAEMGFEANGCVSKATKKKTIIDRLLKNSNAMLVINRLSGKIEVAIDNGRDYPVASFNSENIISISTSKSFSRKTDGRKIKYINAAADYETDTIIFMRDGEDYDPATDTLTELAPEYVTTYEHAYKIAWRDMAEELAQPRTATIKVGPEAAYYPLFARVVVQHPSLKNGITHALIKSVTYQNNKLKSVELNTPVTLNPTKAYGVIINAVSPTARGVLPFKVSGSGKTTVLTLIDSYAATAPIQPTAGNVATFGELDENDNFSTVSTDMKIISYSENDNGYTLTCVDYNAAMYEYGELPEYHSNLTAKPTSTGLSIEDVREYVTAEDLTAEVDSAISEGISADLSEVAQAAVDTVVTGHKFTNIYKIKNPDYTLEDLIRKMDEDASNANASIQISEGEILMQVQDMRRGLTAQLDIQAGSITQLVEGGGSSGSMALSLQLPALIPASTRIQLINVTDIDKFNAVYGQVPNSDYYGIKNNATQADIKILWEAAVEAGLLASQIDLSATQIKIAAEHVIITDGSETGETLIEGGKIRSKLIEVSDLLARNATVTGTLTLDNITGSTNGGIIQSSNYNGELPQPDGQINNAGSDGWLVAYGGAAVFNNLYANGYFFSKKGYTFTNTANIEFNSSTGGSAVYDFFQTLPKFVLVNCGVSCAGQLHIQANGGRKIFSMLVQSCGSKLETIEESSGRIRYRGVGSFSGIDSVSGKYTLLTIIGQWYSSTETIPIILINYWHYNADGGWSSSSDNEADTIHGYITY